MNKIMKFGLVVLMVCVAVVAMAQETKYQDGTTSAAATFGPQLGRQVVKSVFCTTDKFGAAVKFYARGGAGKAAPTATPTNATTIIYISNASYGFTTNDLVVYAHANGTMDYTTLSDASTTNVTLAAGITVAGASGDYLYEVTQQGQLEFDTKGANTSGTITNVYWTETGDLFASPGDSPVRVVLDGTSNAVLTVTVGP